ncbi:DUF3515 domain-containing protein [Angustibacter sp. Root456]|uniref:DUF3515 domain-containing protein n=1 Tax=Angustibacter sp. Root456 TaxID=1736539 RepID=UPI0006F8C7A8|nr:DUF3515 domain-containing protein [Angustibacter sp. Root456]KQX69575.1 hypothetical protein ASD06_00460 [Angustibacter sp. Root456]
MHRRPRLTWLLAAAVALAAVTAGTVWWLTRPLEVTAPVGAADPACAELAAKLPASVQGQPRVATSSDSPAVAAWGDPAVIWRCGVRPPGPTTDECIEVNGVDWVRHPLKDGQSFTTFGRDPAVQVLVPNAYAPEPLVLPPFSDVVAAIAQGEHRCR